MLYKEEVYDILGAAFEVHKVLGCGLVEAVYQDAFAIELAERNIEFEKEKIIKVYYKDTELDKYFKADFVCYNKIILELKAVSSILPEHKAQIINYLKLSNLRLGLLLNFGSTSLQYERIIL